MNNKKCKFNSKLWIFLTGVIILCIIAVLSIDNSAKIEKTLKEQYNIDVEVVSVKEEGDITTYNLIETSNGVEFIYQTYMENINIDGAIFGKIKKERNNYYSSLTKSISKQLESIAQKYNVEFKQSYEGFIGTMIIKDNNGMSYDKIVEALNELMAAYHFKAIPKFSYGDEAFISVELNGTSVEAASTNMTFKYTAYGENVEQFDGQEEFNNQWDIPNQLQDDAISYINSIYVGNNYILETKIIPESYEIYNDTYISYLIKNDTLKFKKEFRFNLDRYREDFKNNKLKTMDNYMSLGIEYVY